MRVLDFVTRALVLAGCVAASGIAAAQSDPIHVYRSPGLAVGDTGDQSG